jgi:hypothetical protein
MNPKLHLIVAKSKEWAFLLLQGNLVLIVWTDLLLFLLGNMMIKMWIPLQERYNFRFLFPLMKALLTRKEDGLGFGIWVSISHCTYPFLYFSVGKQDGMWLFLFETSTYNCCFQISNQNRNNVYYIWGWDLRTPLPIFKVDRKQTWCLFC